VPDEQQIIGHFGQAFDERAKKELAEAEQ